MFAGQWVQLEIIKLIGVSQSQKDESFMFSLICDSKFYIVT